MGQQKGTADRCPNVYFSDLTPISRPERTRRSLRRLVHPPEHRQHHRTRWKGLRRPQETFLLLHRGRLLLSTFHHRRVRFRPGSGRTWCPTIHNPFHQHPRAMRQDFSSRRSLQVGPAPRRQRRTFVVDMSTFSNNQPRQHPHRRRRLLHFQLHWIFIKIFYSWLSFRFSSVSVLIPHNFFYATRRTA